MARKVKLGAGYRQRKDGRLEYRWTGEDGKRYSVCGHSIEECKVKEQEKRRILEKTSYTRNTNLTLAEYFEEFQAGRKGTVKESTICTESCIFKVISEELGKEKLSKIEKRQVQRFQDSLKDHYTTSYINSIMKLLDFIMKTAEEEELIEKNPCKGIKQLQRTETPARETKHRALTPEETVKFFESASKSNSWYYNLYDFMVNTGCRIGEVAALKRKDIDYKNNVIHIRHTVTRTAYGEEIGNSAKTRTSNRDIPMNEAIKAVIRRQEQKNREVFGEIIEFDGFLFQTLKGSMISENSVLRDIKAILKETGIDYFTPHAFRDTFATRAIESGMNPRTLQEILGHSSFSMTMDLYAHVMENTKQKEMNQVKIR